MATVRIEKNANFTTLSNRCLDDERLSLKAVGLLTYMLRLPDDWDFTIEWLAKKHKDGEDSIRSAMKELMAAGYVIRGDQCRDSRGNFKGADYIVREEPAEEEPATVSENPTRTVSENPASENPASENPTSENPTSENPTQLNTKIPSTKEPIPPEAPQGARREVEIWEPEMFERFWRAYPKKKDKTKAIREWNRLKADRKLMMEMSAALGAQKASEEWQRDNGRAIPYPCRWLSHRRWEDALDIETSSPRAREEERPEWV